MMALAQTGPGWLFCPADRPERFEKAAAAADVVILDLEDGVAAKDREAARTALIDTPLDPARTVVRINPATTADHALDLEALSRTEYTTVMLAKTETPEQVGALAPLDVVVLIETPLGALAVTELARVDNAFALMWGAEDLFAVPAVPRTASPTAATATSPSTCGRRRCWRPRPTGGWRWTRCTSTSRTSTGCAPRPTTPSPSGSTPRSPSTRRRWRSSAPATRPPTSRSNGRDTFSRPPAMNAASSNSRA